MARPFLMPLNEATERALKVPPLMPRECNVIDCRLTPTHALLIPGDMVDGHVTVKVNLLCDEHARKAVAAGAKAPAD